MEEPDSNVVFDAKSLGLPELGFMVENRVLQLALWQECENTASRPCLAKLINLYQPKQQKEWMLALDDGHTYKLSLWSEPMALIRKSVKWREL